MKRYTLTVGGRETTVKANSLKEAWVTNVNAHPPGRKCQYTGTVRTGEYYLIKKIDGVYYQIQEERK